jgi:O-6-methylguanine DNA methyltransferase
MTTSIETALGGLATEPSGLAGKVFASVLHAPSVLGEVFVAFTDVGVEFVRTAESVDGDDAAFRAVYRARFGRPLRWADRAPAGLLPALRGRRATVALDLRTATPFERAVLTATGQIPAGQVRSYGWIARAAGSPLAVRAAGSALARNPVPLLVPCHRVVRADGVAGQYLFGSDRKQKLLRAEHVDLDEVAALAAAGVHYVGSDTTAVVCLPSCADARRITPAHRHGFRTLAAATHAGYRPCLRCRPAGPDVP